jgi:cell division septum initiation protein DivIVA
VITPTSAERIKTLASSSRRAAIGSLLGLALVLASLTFGVVRLNRTQKQLDELVQDVNRLEKERNDLDATVSAGRRELASLEQLKASTAATLDRLKSELESVQKMLEEAETSNSSHASTLERAIAHVADIGTDISVAQSKLEGSKVPGDEEWGVVWGSDRTLTQAKYETDTVAPKLGLPNPLILLRHDRYRSVSIAPSRDQAQHILAKARQRRADAYVVRMSTWCPNRSARTGYDECTESPKKP